MKTILAITALIAVTFTGAAFALESESAYLLDDSESISILIDVDANGVATFGDAFITPEGGIEEFVLATDSVTISRISDDHNTGLFYGKTVDGESVVVRYWITGEDTVQLAAKVWTDTGKEKIVSDGEIIPLF